MIGQRIRGRFFLLAYLGMLAASALFWGTGLGSICLGIAVSVHASAVLDILNHAPARFITRLAAVATILIVLGVAMYFPLLRFANRVAMPLVVNFNTPDLKEGDVLLVNHWSAPRPGNVVVYALPNARLAGLPVQFAYGQWVDRILAGPGDHVVWEQERLVVNGEPSPLLPVNPRLMPERLELDIPLDHYFIYPTAVQLRGNMNRNDIAERVLRAVSLVPAERIEGTVYFRNNPLTRFGLIR